MRYRIQNIILALIIIIMIVLLNTVLTQTVYSYGNRIIEYVDGKRSYSELQKDSTVIRFNDNTISIGRKEFKVALHQKSERYIKGVLINYTDVLHSINNDEYYLITISRWYNIAEIVVYKENSFKMKQYIIEYN